MGNQMIDLAPNDLSHLSDEEFNALAPQGYHATGPAKSLSLAAQAVMKAAAASYWDEEYEVASPAVIAAAALRAAADQMGSYQSKKFLYSIADAMKLRDIAAELEQS